MMATCPDGHQSGATDYCDECGLSMSGPVHSGTGGAAAVHSDNGSGASLYGAAGEPCPNCLLPRQAGDTFCEGCGFPFDQEQNGPTLDAPDVDIEVEIRRAEEARRKTEEAQRAAEEARRKAEEEKRAKAKQPGPGPGPVPGPGPGPVNQGSVDGRPDPQTGGASTPNSGGGAPAPVQWIAIAGADRAYYDAVVAEGEIDANAYPFPPYCPERQFELKGDTVRIGRSGKRGNVDIDLTGPPTDPGVSHLHAVLQQRPDGGWAVVDLESMNGTVLNDDTAPIPPNQAFPVEAGHRIHVGVWTTLTLIQLS